jgi:hypothetical protein
VSHLFYRFDRARLAALTQAERVEGVRLFCEALDPAGPLAPTRLQTWLVPGHKADFGVMAMDPSPLKVDDVHQRLLAGPLGQAIEPTYSLVRRFISALVTVLLAGFGRAAAEVGAVMIVGGNINGFTRVMTTAIALETSKGDLPLAMGLGLILIAIVFAINASAWALRFYAERRIG